MEPVKTITFTLKTECDKCGDMIPVNGPLQHVTCGSCQAEYDLTPGLWADQVASAAEGYTIMNNPYTCNATQDPSPMCPACEGHFPFDDAAVEGDEVIHCPGCGHAIHSYPAPEWLSKELPAVFHVIGGERESGEAGGPQVEPGEGDRPVVLSCPNCGGGLKATGASERMIPCGHCGSDVYLPDGVWRRLHPVDVVTPWTLAYRGYKLETAGDIHLEEERALAKRLAAEREKRRTEEEDLKRRARKSRDRVVTFIIVGAIVAFVGLVLAVSAYQ